MNKIDAKTLRALMLKAYWQEFLDVIGEDSFESVAAKKLYKTFARMHDETPEDLTLDSVGVEIEAFYHLKLKVRDELLGALRKVGAQSIDTPVALKNTITRHIQKATCLEAANYISTRVDEDDFDVNVPMAMFQKAADMHAALDADVVDYRTAAAPGRDDRTGVVGFGLHPDIDLAFAGGLANGEIVVYLAPSGRGKTSHMCWSAAYAAKLGCNILHISCEDHAHKVRQRYDSCLTGLDRGGLLANPERVMERRAVLPGKIYIQDWSSREVRASDIRSLVMRMNKSGRPVDYVVLDYLGKMSADTKMWDGARPFGKIAAEVRRVGSELGFKILTGWQSNRAGFTKVLQSEQDVADDIGVYREVDGMIGININDEQLKEKRAIHNVIKCRDGTFKPARIHHVDMDTMQFFKATTQGKDDSDVEEL